MELHAERLSLSMDEMHLIDPEVTSTNLASAVRGCERLGLSAVVIESGDLDELIEAVEEALYRTGLTLGQRAALEELHSRCLGRMHFRV